MTNDSAKPKDVTELLKSRLAFDKYSDVRVDARILDSVAYKNLKNKVGGFWNDHAHGFDRGSAWQHAQLAPLLEALITDRKRLRKILLEYSASYQQVVLMGIEPAQKCLAESDAAILKACEVGKMISGIWYKTEKNMLIEIRTVYSIWWTCCVSHLNGSFYSNVTPKQLNTRGWVKVGSL